MKIAKAIIGLVMCVVFIVIGFQIGARNSERKYLALSSIADASRLKTNIILRGQLIKGETKKTFFTLDRVIANRISILNTYSDLSSVPNRKQFVELLKGLKESWKLEERDTEGLDVLIEKVGK